MEIIEKPTRGAGNIFPPPLKPYDYQVPIIKIMIETILAGKNGLVIQPTATGKSIEAAFVARASILLHGKRGIYLYDENEGLQQARQTFEYIFAQNDVKCANFFGYGKEHGLVDDADMVFASFQSLNNHHEKWYLTLDPTRFDFMIVNEAHGGQAITYKEVINYFQCSHIGMTATPDRMDGKDILEIFDDVIYEIPLEDAIVNGWVAQIEYHIKSHGLSTQKLKKICHEVLEEGKRISIKQLNETIFIDALDDEVFKEVYTYAFPTTGDPRQTLLFCENITHANRVAKRIRQDGHTVEAIHSHYGKGHNRKSMLHFREGKIQFLVSVNKLNEDIDVPNVEVAAFLRSTSSLTVFFQQLGRTLRKTLYKRKAIILDFVANVERIMIISDLMGRVKTAQEKFKLMNGLPLQKDPLYVTGTGFEFMLTDEMVDMMKILDRLQGDIFIPTIEKALEELKEKGITDYWSLIQFGVSAFHKSTFGRFGKSFALLNFIIGENDISVNFKTIMKLADKLGWTPTEEDKNKRYKEELAKHGITDYWTLVIHKAIHFSNLKFGKFGRASEFSFLVLGSKLRGLDLSTHKPEIFEKLADKLGWTPTEEEKKRRFKEELAKYGIVDYWTLTFLGMGGFNKTKWGIFGKGKAFAGTFFKEFKHIRRLEEKDLDRLAVLLGWSLIEEQKIQRYKEEFAKHGITDYWTLLGNSYSYIRRMDFGIFGKGFSFCSLILSKTVDQLDTNQITDELAKKFGWLPSQKERIDQEKQNIVKYKEALAKHGIVDYWTLVLKFRFNELDFGSLGKAKSFLSLILQKEFGFITKELIVEVAEKIGWAVSEEQKIQRYKEELAKHGITDYWSLVFLGANTLKRMKFGMFGGGGAFFNFTMNKVLENDGDLKKLADKLGWTSTEEERIKKYCDALIEKGIKDYWGLLMVDVGEFRELDFGIFGKGTAFCCHVLGKSIKSVSRTQRLEIAEKLGWMLTEEEKNKRYKEELAKHGILNRVDLNSIPPYKFEDLGFGMFGKGWGFIKYILGSGVLGRNKSLTRKVLNNLADKICLK